jgi:hypothetical protein
MVAGGICGLKRTLERVDLFWGWLQLQLGDQLHILKYSTDVRHFQVRYIVIRAAHAEGIETQCGALLATLLETKPCSLTGRLEIQL